MPDAFNNRSNVTKTLGRPTRLRRAQRNMLYRLIEEVGADPRQFSWEEPRDSTLSFQIGPTSYGFGSVCTLRHGPTDSVFKTLANIQALDGTLLDEERYSFSYPPPPVFSVVPYRFKALFPDVFARKDPIHFQDTKNYLVEWCEIEDHFSAWLRMVTAAYEVVREEEQTPDFWATLGNVAIVFLSTLAGGGNAPFSSAEISHIAQSLDALRLEVQQLGILSSVQFEALSAELSEQAEAAKRLGRKDWANQFIAALMGLALLLDFPREAVNRLFALVFEKMHLLWHELQRLLS